MTCKAPLVFVGLLLASAALAHTGLRSSTPAKGASVEAPVEEIVLEFNDAVRLTVVVLTDAGGGKHALGSLPAETAPTFAVAVAEPLAAGEYVVTWRAVGADTHIVSGEIPFEVVGAAAH
jgi:copper resistance protein C